MTWVPVKFTNPYMYIHISPFFFSTPPPPPKDVISMQILASQKGSKKLFHAAWFPWFAFWVVFPLFSTFYYYCCLPQTVFLQYSYICKSTYHRCAAFLASAFTLSPALPRSSESFTSSYVGHRVSRSQLVPSASAASLHHALKKYSLTYFQTTYELFQDWLHVIFWFSLIIRFPETDFIPFLLRGLQPLNPFACWYKSCLYAFCYLLRQPFGSVLSAIPLQVSLVSTS